MTATLTLEQVTRRFGATVAVDRLDLIAREREHLAVVGPSGCGKSTLLRLVAGLLAPDEGTITLAGSVVAGSATWVGPEHRRVGLVFQDHALFPHLTVADNVAFGVDRRDRTRDARVRGILEMVGLVQLSGRFPHELSGGEQQRVALARALAPRPAVVLLDEPFSNLDTNLRAQVRQQTTSVLREANATVVFVTHDQEEALAVGDRVAVMREGRVVQLAEPSTVFHAPADRFVATFMGEADFVRGRCDGTVVRTPFGTLSSAVPHADVEVDVMLRPHEVLCEPDPDGDATVVSTEFRGAFVSYGLQLAGGATLRSLVPHTVALATGTRVRVRVVPDHAVATFPRGTEAEGAPTP